jgi:hypothetical protein
MLYVSRAFNLPLEAAKTLMVESEYGTTDAWLKELESDE